MGKLYRAFCTGVSAELLIVISWKTWVSFNFKSMSFWDASWRYLFDPSMISFKGWFSGTVNTCSLEELQLCVRSCDRGAEAFSYTPTTQVAVVCQVKRKKKKVFYFSNPETASLCLPLCLDVGSCVHCDSWSIFSLGHVFQQ